MGRNGKLLLKTKVNVRPTLFVFLLCHFALRLVPTWLIEGCHLFWNAITTVPSRKTLCMSGMHFLRDSLPGLASRASRNLCCTLGPVFRRIRLPLNASCYHTDILCNVIFELVLYMWSLTEWWFRHAIWGDVCALPCQFVPTQLGSASFVPTECVRAWQDSRRM